MSQSSESAPRVAEFFAGVGLVRMALEQEGCRVVFANDISPLKRQIYAANFDDSDYLCGDIKEVTGNDVPDVDLATASFPCTDLSLAGNRAGLKGQESGLLHEFLRIIGEMGSRRPAAVLLENVVGFATSNNGADLYATIAALNAMGYTCDVLSLDARYFVPQSRPRLFVIGFQMALPDAVPWTESRIRPPWVMKFVRSHPDLMMQAARLPTPERVVGTVHDILEQFPATDEIWWDVTRMTGFLSSLSPLQADRLETMRRSLLTTAATAYRRTREGKAVWEVRRDSISGCLRTARGGSSKQAIVVAGQGSVFVRWMTAREYARLQGAPNLKFGQVSESQAKFALGDAVCVPAVAWLAQRYLVPVSRTKVSFYEMVDVYA